MKKAIFLNQETKKFLVTNGFPGVFGFINFIEKKAWLSYSENVSEAIIRNAKLIQTRQHKIRNLDNWDICIFENTKTKQEAKNAFRIYCQNYRSKGLEILNKELKYKVWGEIGQDFRDQTKFLYFIWAGVKGGRPAVLGMFESATEGERYLKEFKAGKVTDFPPSSRRLVIDYRGTDFNQKEYKRLFK